MIDKIHEKIMRQEIFKSCTKEESCQEDCCAGSDILLRQRHLIYFQQNSKPRNQQQAWEEQQQFRHPHLLQDTVQVQNPACDFK